MNGESLFDPRAASTQYNVEFGKDMKNFRTEDPYLNKRSGSNQWRSREEMKDVVYNSGKVELTVSPGGAFERFMLHQGDPDNPILISDKHTGWIQNMTMINSSLNIAQTKTQPFNLYAIARVILMKK